MSVYHGSSGSLTIGGNSVANVQEWTVTYNKEMVETTSLGSTARVYSAGLESFEGSCEAIIDSAGYDFNTALKAGSLVAAVFYVQSGSSDYKLSGDVLLSSVETTHVFDDVARVSVTFTGSDSAGLTVDETP